MHKSKISVTHNSTWSSFESDARKDNRKSNQIKPNQTKVYHFSEKQQSQRKQSTSVIAELYIVYLKPNTALKLNWGKDDDHVPQMINQKTHKL